MPILFNLQERVSLTVTFLFEFPTNINRAETGCTVVYGATQMPDEQGLVPLA